MTITLVCSHCVTSTNCEQIVDRLHKQCLFDYDVNCSHFIWMMMLLTKRTITEFRSAFDYVGQTA